MQLHYAHFLITLDAMTKAEDEQIAEWRERVGKRIQRRRESRYRNMREAANTAGVSETLWGEVERGYKIISASERRPVSPLPRSLRYIATALGWRDDAVERLQQGLEPEELPLTPRDRGLGEWLDHPEVAEPTPGLKPPPPVAGVDEVRPRRSKLYDPAPPPPPRYPTPPIRADTPEALRRAFEELEHWFDELNEKVAALSWQSKNLVMGYVNELLEDETQAWLGQRLGEVYEPPPDEPQELRDAKEELALAAAGEIDLDDDTRAALERIVNETLDDESQ